MATGYGAGLPGIDVRFPAGTRDFSLLTSDQTGSRAHKVSYPMGAGNSFPGGKVTEADHSPLPSAEIKEWWSYASTPPMS
jgi:hypothetical protein